MSSKNPIPSHARCVFKGKLFEVWQWDQKMFDGSVQLFEKLKRPNTGQVIPVVGDKILMQIEQHPHMKCPLSSIPGGKCDKGESPLDTAKRELLEETGYTSDDWTLWNEVEPIFKIEWVAFTYIARNCVLGKAPENDAGEKIEIQLVDFEEFMRVATEYPLFYSPEIVPELLRLRLDPKKRKEFRGLLFGKKSPLLALTSFKTEK